MQIYLPFVLKNINKVIYLKNCPHDIKSWMVANFLQLNESKTEVILFGPTLFLILAHKLHWLNLMLKILESYLILNWSLTNKPIK